MRAFNIFNDRLAYFRKLWGIWDLTRVGSFKDFDYKKMDCVKIKYFNLKKYHFGHCKQNSKNIYPCKKYLNISTSAWVMKNHLDARQKAQKCENINQKKYIWIEFISVIDSNSQCPLIIELFLFYASLLELVCVINIIYQKKKLNQKTTPVFHNKMVMLNDNRAIGIRSSNIGKSELHV